VLAQWLGKRIFWSQRCCISSSADRDGGGTQTQTAHIHGATDRMQERESRGDRGRSTTDTLGCVGRSKGGGGGGRLTIFLVEDEGAEGSVWQPPRLHARPVDEVDIFFGVRANDVVIQVCHDAQLLHHLDLVLVKHLRQGGSGHASLSGSGGREVGGRRRTVMSTALLESERCDRAEEAAPEQRGRRRGCSTAPARSLRCHCAPPCQRAAWRAGTINGVGALDWSAVGEQ
jgi:hypothetical protein